jgi:virginiamycin B lyase
MSKRLLRFAPAALLCCAAFAARGDDTFPEGAGKKLIEAACGACHELGRISSAGYTEEEWRNNLSMMVNVGAPLAKDQFETVVQYLTKSFPAKPKPPAVVVQGPVKVAIEEWLVPTPGSRPHDPLATPDGAIWYTGQFANLLGRMDPKTHQIKEYPLPANAGPHGLIDDKDGNIWYAANFGSHIGKLDPKTGKVTQYPMPDPKVKDVHTLIWDQKGMMFFTAQNANVVGRLNPKTGEVKIVPSPTPKSRPYGLVVSSKGIPYFVEFGANKIASINPDTLEIKEYVLPHADSRPRRIAITSDDVLWYADYSRGYLGRFDPATGKATEWASPGGPRSQPYGMAVINDVIWYNEAGTKPNTMVRFDPKTEKFQTWIIPSGGNVVRNVSVTRDGNIAIASSGVNRIGLVKIERQ